ncbi:MAG: ferritin [Bacteroidota bacterium]
MLKKKIEDSLNEQLSKEAYASQLYLAMASWADAEGYEGIANWFYAQAEEERVHMMKFVRFINERGGKAIIPKVEKPPKDFAGVKEAFDASLDHEIMVTESIHEIVDLTLNEKDFATNKWLQWFVDEQMEEEASVQNIIDKLKMMGDKNIYIFDRDIMSMRAE